MQLVVLHTFLMSQDMTTYEYIMHKRDAQDLRELEAEAAKYGAEGARRSKRRINPLIQRMMGCVDWIVFCRCGRRRRRKPAPADTPANVAAKGEDAQCDGQIVGADANTWTAEASNAQADKSSSPSWPREEENGWATPEAELPRNGVGATANAQASTPEERELDRDKVDVAATATPAAQPLPPLGATGYAAAGIQNAPPEQSDQGRCSDLGKIMVDTGIDAPASLGPGGDDKRVEQMAVDYDSRGSDVRVLAQQAPGSGATSAEGCSWPWTMPCHYQR
jgi:hypothetical protein